MIYRSLLFVIVVTVLAACGPREPAVDSGTTDTAKTIGHVERLNAGLDTIVDSDEVFEVLAEGYEWSEGPVWAPAIQSILFSDVPRNTIYRWSESAGASAWLRPSGYTGVPEREGEEGSNGLILDLEGRLLLAQHGDRRIARLDAPWDAPEPVFSTLTDTFEGKRYNSPNDLAIHSSGDVYFTDPPYGLVDGPDDPARQLDVFGVYRLAADGSVALLVDSLTRPNGVILSPDEKTLYVANSDRDRPVTMAYDVSEDGSLSDGRVFFDSWGDGMAVDQNGNVYLTDGRQGVLVIAPDGIHLGSLVTTQRTANCTFGDDGSTLYVTADMYLLRMRLKAKGAGF